MRIVSPFDASTRFAAELSEATAVGSGRDWYSPSSDGTEINRTEAYEALRTLDGVPAAQRSGFIRDVLDKSGKGQVTLTPAAIRAFVHAYLSAQPPASTRMTGWQSRLGSKTPAIDKPAFVFVADAGAGGSSTQCAKGIVDDRPSFLKAHRGSMMHRTRHAVFESDVLAGQIFAKLGLIAPQARIIDVSANPSLKKELGRVCLDMEMVDKSLVGGAVQPGLIEDVKKIDVDAFLKMLVVDLIIGNADRRGPNFFVAERDGKTVPIPIDNNCGFLSGLTNNVVTSQANFKKSFGVDGPVDFQNLDPRALGSITLMLADAPDYRDLLKDPAARARLPAIVDEVVRTLDDAFFGGLVDALPREIVPHGTKVKPWREDETVDASRLPPAWKDAFDEAFAYVPGELSGRALFDARKRELKEVFSWRRDHVKQALAEHLAAAAPSP